MGNILERLLPGCEKPVMVKDIINTESRFNNRRRKEDWLTPTATQLLRTHLNLVEKVCRILPVSGIALEANRFAFMELEAGGHLESGVDYQCGPLYGYRSIREALEELQDGRCLLCGERAIEHDHHLVLRSRVEATLWRIWPAYAKNVIRWYIRTKKLRRNWKPSRQARTKSMGLYPY